MNCKLSKLRFRALFYASKTLYKRKQFRWQCQFWETATVRLSFCILIICVNMYSWELIGLSACPLDSVIMFCHGNLCLWSIFWRNRIYYQIRRLEIVRLLFFCYQLFFAVSDCNQICFLEFHTDVYDWSFRLLLILPTPWDKSYIAQRLILAGRRWKKEKAIKR